MEQISVIIPYHNTEGALFDRCLASLCRRSYRQMELVVDDRWDEEKAAYADLAAERVRTQGIPRQVVHVTEESGGVSRFALAYPIWMVISYLKLLIRVRARHRKRVAAAWNEPSIGKEAVPL